MKKIIVFGATGYIGDLVIQQLQNTPYKLCCITYHNNFEKAKQIQNIYNCDIVKINNPDIETIKQLLKKYKPYIVVNAMSSFDGFIVSYITLKSKIKLCLANKESIVIGYQFLLPYKKYIFPIDSEHSSLYELTNNDYNNIDEIFITASGGKYFNNSLSEIKDVLFKDVIKHPNWQMGEQISIDSSNMINKFYELVEAHFFYNDKKITPIRHKQSIVHAIVKYKNNSYMFNASTPNMSIYVNLALNEFKKNKPVIEPLNLNNLSLDFEYIDKNRFIALQWFDEFTKTKNYLIPIIVNIANEYLFNKFKNCSIKYTDIEVIINKCLIEFKNNDIFYPLTIKKIPLIKNLITNYLKNYFKYTKNN